MAQVPFLVGADVDARDDDAREETEQDALVVLVADTVEQRLRLLSRVGGVGPVLVVSSVEEAQRILHPQVTEEPSATPAPPNGVLGATGLRIVADRHAVAAGGREARLTPLEFALFTLLVTELGKVWPFEELSKRVWHTPHVGDASQVHAVVKRLRRKLGVLPSPVVVEAVRGVGFRAVVRRTLKSVSADPTR